MMQVYNGERFVPEECDGEMKAEHYQRYYLAQQLSRGRIILDAACGEGYGSGLLSEVAERVVGLDIDDEAICRAKKKYERDNLSFVTGSIESLPFESKCFDMVVSFETIEHVDSDIQKKFLSEILRVLKDDGVLIMSTPNKKIYTDSVGGDNKYHIKEFYGDEYMVFLHQYFKNIECVCQYPYTGYFLSREDEKFQNVKEVPCVSMDDSRYIIAICSNAEREYAVDTEKTVIFDNSMYYDLYRVVHKQERQIIQMRQEVEEFGKRKEEDIVKQKEYIFHLEKDIKQQREYISKMEKDIKQQREYISKMEKDIEGQRKYILRKENDIEEQKKYIVHLEKDICFLKNLVE